MRTAISILLAILLAILIYLGNFAWWLDRQVMQTESFVDSSVEALGRESSRDAMGRLIVDRLVDEYPLLIILESNLVGLFSELLAAPALDEVLTFVAVEIHDRIVTGDDEAIVVDLLGYREAILGPVEAVAPRLAALVPDEWFTSVEVLEEAALPDVSRQARWVGPVKYLALFGAIALTVFILSSVKRRYRAVAMIGIAFVLAGFGTATIVPGGKSLTLGQISGPSVETIIGNTYDEFANYLKASALTFALIGIALVALGVARWAAQDMDKSTGVTPPVV